MTCASCAVSVESMLKSQPGVVDASVNYANATVSIEFIPEVVQTESLRQVVQSIGYDILIDETASSDETVENIQREKSTSSKRRPIGLWLCRFLWLL